MIKTILLTLLFLVFGCTTKTYELNKTSATIERDKISWSCFSRVDTTQATQLTSCNIINASQVNNNLCFDIFYVSNKYDSQYVNVDYVCLDSFTNDGLPAQVTIFTRGHDYNALVALCGQNMDGCSLNVVPRGLK